MQKILISLSVILLLSFCDGNKKNSSFQLKGTLSDSKAETLYLEKLGTSKQVIIDSVILDENGNFEMKRDDSRKRYVHHRAWIKTDTDGKYTFYTFMPGKYLRSKELKQIHRVIKEPGKPEYDINPFFFNDDPLIPELTLACRSRMINSLLRLQKQGDMYVATKDIKLDKSVLLDQ